ncbi:GNAT family N-acetyltransferase [Nonlabens antarcticus]|uniref:GNAT family N-acetyltransferase n=1 Tax=Nonlabens antarcticus TaxID=392714 RepID=UPI00189137BA|nr:GNAT family N-acetyltransferase [Nonlabens antarcticus]
MISLEKATLADLDAILSIEQKIFVTDSYPPFVVRQLFDISSDYFIVAREDEKVLGYAIGGINVSQKHGWLLSIGVQNDARGKGLGKLLTERLVQLLQAHDCSVISLTVYPDNPHAMKIYTDLGFRGDQVIDNYFLDHEKRIIMNLKF